MPTFLIITAVVAAAFMARFYVAVLRVHSGRAKNVVEGMLPQRLVYRRLSRQIRREHGR
ncbi:hypothetical protein [Streptomyces sp. HF10]|uniref:hypothetical protein n=1 Tax=Streptomyces sp. HF10 TaxID=2692233 RepID=UPI001319564F|nr:hypothetical protein [Streptomyces sp. HF10]QHC33873.1 hypothetical protein GR129_34780 [Streptomyces sp. HF10]